MPRFSRLLISLVLLGALGACGNKGDLVKPAAPADTAKVNPAQG
jgi:predicted small lipoprotein YifL